ncbi:hypothetical protein [Aldersonia sp. NBC_00410]|uniref:hypothetical protein n=1 Tax=Aldersonia sp. NBC_00410 TaxID=2975954 RepID=UPI0022585314|nr:hypothetical protein [Aldersonia sp. NBC_00410]
MTDSDHEDRSEQPKSTLDREARRALSDAAKDYYDDDVPVDDDITIVHYLSRTEVAAYLGLAGVKSLSRVVLPRPDVMVGNHKGWTPTTIDNWKSNRPGPGWWGAHDRQRPPTGD